jgi:hypothetical protein
MKTDTELELSEHTLSAVWRHLKSIIWVHLRGMLGRVRNE